MSEHTSDLLVYVNGQLFPRREARVSVFDASFQSGDAVWEGLRVYHGRVFQLNAHLARLFDSAKALAITLPLSRQQLAEALFATLRANNLDHDTHIRLMVTRGERKTSGMDPRNADGPATVVIIAERKPPLFDKRGVRLTTSSVRRPAPDALDSRIHHANQLNNILAKIEANRAGVDDAIMLDQRGFVAETNSMNLFIVKEGVIITPPTEACLAGITRALVLREARTAGLSAIERHISLLEVHTADEVFLTGTVAEIVPAIEVDGRTIGDGMPGPTTLRVTALYHHLTSTLGEPIPAALPLT